MLNAIFDGWGGIVRVLIAAPIMYVAIIFFIRITGKRSASSMNNFDWVVTVALGSLVASGIILDSVTLIESLLATALLLGLQYSLTNFLPHSAWLRRLVKAEPRMLIENGKFDEDAMRKERVSKAELLSAIRIAGYARVEQIRWVILETDSQLSVLAYDAVPDDIQLQGFEVD